MRSDAKRLADILSAVARVEARVPPGTDFRAGGELVESWVLHNILIIGEAARGLSRALKDEHPEVPWTQIAGIRNIIVHEYWNVDLDVVQVVVSGDLPDLKALIETVVEILGRP